MRDLRVPVLVGSCAFAFLVHGGLVRAETLTAGPYSFSDELGGMRLKSVSGTGTASDPIVLVEEFLDVSPAVLTVRRLAIAGAQTSTAAPASFPPILNLEKVVLNQSRRAWIGFELELEEIRGEPSTHADGLSFDQIAARPSRVGADRFTRGERTFEPGDRLLFFGGAVNAGEEVRFTLVITDTTPYGTFYLVQYPQLATAALPMNPGRDAAATNRHDAVRDVVDIREAKVSALTVLPRP